MLENKYEEKKKDEIVQAIYDTLESEGWGDTAPRLNVEIMFRGRMDYEIKIIKFLTK